MTFEEAAAVMMGGSGTANATMFSAICSLPVVVQADIKINGAATGYGIKIFRANPFTPGFGTVTSNGEYDSDGTLREPPDRIEEREWYYCGLCIGDNVIGICSGAKCDNYVHTVGYEWWSINGGSNRIRVKYVENYWEYNFIRDNMKVFKNTGYVGIGYDTSWEHEYILYDIDDNGNITRNPTQSYTESGTYDTGFYATLSYSSSNYLHGYPDDETMRKKLAAFKQAIDNM